MARKVRVRRNWSKKNGFKAATFLKEIEGQMTDNNKFKDPAIPLPDMEKQAEQTFSAYSNRKNGAKARADYQMSLANTNEMLNKQADYVQSVANNDSNIISSSGFTPTNISVNKKPAPAIPGMPTIKNENGGLSLSIDKVMYADNYFWIVFLGEAFPITIAHNQMQVNNAGNYIMIPAGTTRECVRGLASGTKVTAQVLAQNAAGKSEFTLPVTTYFVQS